MFQTGTIIDERYEIVCEIGRGGYGAVYKARQLQFDRIVAVKVLNADLTVDSEGPARFEREAKLISAMKHKNVVAFYGYGVWRGAPYMVMEFLEGTPLDQLLAHGPLDAMRAGRITKQVFEALEAAHASGVVHRDMKPSNIVIVPDSGAKDQVKVIDFGLAKFLPGYGVPGQKLTETGTTLGTCHYMAPEQALGAQIDQRSDIYAAGCILYELLTGSRPFDADNNVAVMYQHLNNEAPPAASLVTDADDYTKALSSIAQKCMEKDPNRRYQNCSGVLADVLSIERGRFIAPIPPKQKLRWQTKIAPACVTVAAIALIAGTFHSMREKKSVSPELQKSSFDFLSECNRTRKCDTAEKISANIAACQAALQADDRDHKLSPSQRFDCCVRLICRFGIPRSTWYNEKNHLYYLQKAEQIWPTVPKTPETQPQCSIFLEELTDLKGLKATRGLYEDLVNSPGNQIGHLDPVREMLADYYFKNGTPEKAAALRKAIAEHKDAISQERSGE